MDNQTQVKQTEGAQDVPQTEIIRQNIEETRSSLTDKLETLEHQVVDTVQETTNAVTDTVGSVKEAVQETVETVKDTVHDTVQTVKSTVQQTVDVVKETFDLRRHVERYPWAMFGGSVGLGYVIGAFVAPPSRKTAASSPGETNGVHAVASHGNGRSNDRHRPRRGPHGKKHESLLQAPLLALKNLAVGATIGIVRDLVKKNVSGELGEQLVHWLDEVSESLSGETIQSPFAGGNREETAKSKEEEPSQATMPRRL